MADPYEQSTTITVFTRTYTFSEAIAYMKVRDKWATMAPPIHWVDVRTGKPVYIGYTS